MLCETEIFVEISISVRNLVIVQNSSACQDLLLIQLLNKQQILGLRSCSALLPVICSAESRIMDFGLAHFNWPITHINIDFSQFCTDQGWPSKT